MMKISVMSWSFASALRSGEMDTAATIRFCREVGVGAVELMDSFIRDEDLPAIRQALAELGGPVVCYDVSGDFVDPDRAARQHVVNKIRASLERAALLGAERVLVIPGTLKEGISPAVGRSWIIEGLKECVPHAVRLGLMLSIEDHPQAALYGRSDHLNAICEAVGPQHLAVTYDVGNFLLAGEDPIEALGRLAPRIVHVHFKDWHIVPPAAPRPARCVTGLDGTVYTGAVLGEGIVDLEGAAAGLRRLGYTGYVSVEYEGVGDPRPAVRQGAECVRSLLGGDGREG